MGGEGAARARARAEPPSFIFSYSIYYTSIVALLHTGGTIAATITILACYGTHFRTHHGETH